MKRMFVVAVALAMWANVAGAAIIVSLVGVVEDATLDNTWLWTYGASLQPHSTVGPGDFFTVYDFPGAASFKFGNNIGVVGSFTESTNGSGPPVIGLPFHADDPLIPNYTVTLNPGETPITAGNTPLTLGALIISAHTNLSTDSQFGAQDNLGTKGNGGDVKVAVPEPGSMTLMLFGLLAVGALAFRRGRHAG